LPPQPGKPVYGPAAREEARRLMREAKRAKINFGWRSKASLCRIARGERPLRYDVWLRARDYMTLVQTHRTLPKRPPLAPWRVQVFPGQGSRLVPATAGPSVSSSSPRESGRNRPGSKRSFGLQRRYSTELLDHSKAGVVASRFKPVQPRMAEAQPLRHLLL